ncbi:MAG: glycoside hydrolase family 3 N-terminal domain-containing protein [Bacteroidota bacterium]
MLHRMQRVDRVRRFRSPLSMVAVCLSASGLLIAQSRDQVARDEARVARAVDSVLAGLTLEEKVGQLVQYTGDYATGPQGRTVTSSQREIVRRGMTGSLLNVFGSDNVRELQHVAVEESRAKIPLLFGLDVIHGFRTVFPIPLAEAASWDPALVENSARISAVEAAAAGIHWTFAPMVDIARDARWGRIAEGAGEDPLLGSLMAAAKVRGFQGAGLSNPSSIVACPKHFAGYGAAEGGRDYNTVELSERTLRDVYLPPFKAAVEAGAGTIMASFNEVNGVPSSANRWLLTTVLREEWGFKGLVVSDWNSIGELIPHGVAATEGDAALLSLEAGLDMDMMSGCYRDQLVALVKRGAVRESTVDEAVRRILRIKYLLGLFDDPYRGISREQEHALTLHLDHVAAARDAARRSIVLLKNEGNILPLKPSLSSIAVIGPLADNVRDPLGPWAGNGQAQDVVSALQGLRSAVRSGTDILYAPGCTVSGGDTGGFTQAVALARKADVVLAFMGESSDMSGEAASRSSLGLPGRQSELLAALRQTGKPLVLVLMNGRPLAIPEDVARATAVVEAWFLGVQAGHAIADVLFGSYNPTGRLPATFPRSAGQEPYYYNHKNTGRPPVDTLNYTSRYIDLPSSPVFPFGFGLSYTTYAYSGLAIANPTLGVGDTLHAIVTVANTGGREGGETVQLYVRDDVGSVTRPVKELKAFQKVRLGPGEKTVVQFALPVDALAFTGLDMRRRVEPGTFTLFIGPNSAEGLQSAFSVRAPVESR